jgi:hypothetical protein
MLSEISLSELAGIFKGIGIKGVFALADLRACCKKFSKEDASGELTKWPS